MHIRDLRRLRPILDYKTACTIDTSIVHSKLDYCNSLFYNSCQMKRLQTIQNAPAQTSPHTCNSCLKINALDKSHSKRFNYKIVSLTYNTLQTSQPSYIRQSLTSQLPGFTRLSLYLSLSRPPVSSSLKFCSCSIAYAAPALWNGLPKDRQVAHPPNPPSNLTYPPLALSPATFHSRLILLLRRDTSAATPTTGYNLSPTLSPRLDLPVF